MIALGGAFVRTHLAHCSVPMFGCKILFFRPGLPASSVKFYAFWATCSSICCSSLDPKYDGPSGTLEMSWASWCQRSSAFSLAPGASPTPSPGTSPPSSGLGLDVDGTFTLVRGRFTAASFWGYFLDTPFPLIDSSSESDDSDVIDVFLPTHCWQGVPVFWGSPFGVQT